MSSWYRILLTGKISASLAEMFVGFAESLLKLHFKGYHMLCSCLAVHWPLARAFVSGSSASQLGVHQVASAVRKSVSPV